MPRLKFFLLESTLYFVGCLLLTPTLALAQTEPPQFMTLDGRLYDSTTPEDPLLDNSVLMKIQILNPTKTCILYEEEQTVSTLSSNGYFNVRVGSPTSGSDSLKRTTNDSGNAMMEIFQNQNASITGKTAGGAGCGYTPVAGETRHFRFVVTPSTTGVTSTLSPDMQIDSVPQSLVAETLQGMSPADFVQINSDVTQAKVNALFGGSYTALSGLLAGTSSLYLRNTTNGTVIPNRTTDPLTPSPGQIWYDSDDNVMRYYDGSTVQTLSSGGADPTKLPLAGGTMAGAIDMGGNDITSVGHITQSAQRTFRFGVYTTLQEATLVATPLLAGHEGTVWYNTTTNKLMFWDGAGERAVSPVDTVFGRTGAVVAAASDYDAVQIDNTPAGTISATNVQAAIDELDTEKVAKAGDTMTGNLTLNAQNEVRYADSDSSNYVAIRSPTVVGSNVTLTLPATAGSANQVLTTDGAGVLSWTTSASAPVSSVFSRTGAVVAVAGDYTATQITNTAAGSIAATNVQAALNELDTEKVATTRAVNTAAGSGLSGGGDLSADRSLSINITGTTALGTAVDAADELLIYDVSGSVLRKATRSQFVLSEAEVDAMVSNNGYISSEADTLATVTGRGAATASNMTLNAQAQMRLADSDSSNYIALASPATVAANVTLILPATAGVSGQYLQTDGAGILSWVTPSGVGETNTASNQGVGGVGLFDAKSTFDLQFRNINAASNKVSVALDAANKEVDINVNEANLSTAVIPNTAAGNIAATNTQAAINELDTEKVATARAVNTAAGSGLTGGGDLSADRSLSVNITGTTVETVAAGADEILIYDTSATALRKMTRSDFLTGYLTTESDTLSAVTGRGASTATTITMSSEAAVRFADTTGGEYAAIKAPANLSANYTLTLPQDDGLSGQYLQTDGAGVLSWVTPSGVGETNTASNQGAGGVGVFKQKSTFDLEFRNINAASNKISVALDAGNNEIDINVNEANLSTSVLANTPAGNIAATNVQAAINELDSEKVAKAGDSMTGNLTMNAQNEVRYADSDSSNYVAVRSPATVGANVTLTLPATAGSASQVLTTDGSGVLSWTTPASSGVTSVFTRTGAVIAVAGDYSATQITNTAAGTIAATDVQTALNELDTEKVATTRTISTVANSGLSGGGDLSANRSLAVDITGSTAETVPAAGDEILVYDTSATALRKMTRANFLTGYLTSEADTLATVTGRGASTSTAITMSSEAAVRFADTTGGEYAAIKSPANLSANYTLTLPLDDGLSGQYLQTDGAGVLSWVTPSGVGETNTASNQGVGGVGVFKQKTTFDLEFRNINAASNKISVALDAANNEIDLNVNEANLSTATIPNTAAGTIAATNTQAAINELDAEKVATTRAVNTAAGSGLSGGGDLSADRSLSVNITGTTAETAPATNDEILIYDTSATALRKMTRANFLTGYLTTEADTLSTVTGRGASTATDITMNAQADVRYADADSSNYVAIQSPTTVATNYTLTLPTTAGVANQVLTTDGAGVLSWTSPSAAGETNTASNQGAAGVGLYDAKSGVDLQFRNINAASNKISVALDAGNKEVDINVNEANLSTVTIPNTAAGTIAATNTQAAINELDTEKVAKAGDAMTGALTMNAQNHVRFADSDSSNYVAIRSPATVGANVTLTLPATAGAANQVLTTDGAGILSWVTPAGVGETNTASNQGVGGVGLYDAKSGVDIQFRNINAASNKISVALDAANKEVDLNVNEANLSTATIPNTAAGTIAATNTQAAINELDTEKVATTRAVNTAAGSGLSGGGDLSADRSLSVNITGTTAETVPAVGDEILIYDLSATALRKMTRANFLTGYLTTEADTLSTVTGRGASTATDITMNAQADVRYADSDSSNYVAIQSPATVGTNYTLTLPTTAGASGQLLRTDGTGVLTWVNQSSVAADSLDFTDFADSMTLDASTTINATGTNVLSINNTGTGNSFVVNDVASDTSPFVIDASGNVGIGTTTASYVLDVAGEVNTSGAYRIGGLEVIKRMSGSFGGVESNLFIGTGETMSGLNTTNASRNVAIGTDAGRSMVDTSESTFVGYAAGQSTTGNQNTFVGNHAAYNNSTGALNLGMGAQVLGELSSGDWNVVLGAFALGRNTTGSSNIVVGGYAAGTQGTVSGDMDNNVVIGYQAGRVMQGGTAGNGSNNNILVGHQAGDTITTGDQNLLIGYDIDTPAATTSNFMSIGNILFATSVDGTGTTVSTGSVGVGTSSPGTRLDVAGAITSRPFGTGTGQTGQIIMRELAAGGTNTATIRVPDALAADYVLTLPADDGNSGQYLQTNGSGVLSWVTPSGVGETNTASNQGVGGVGVFKQKTTFDLEFRNINAASNKISVALDAANNEIDLNVNESNLSTATIPNTAAGTIAATNTQAAINELDTEKVASTRAVNTAAGSGLSGGGDLSADRSLSVNITGTTAETVPAVGDEILIYDLSATALRKMTRANFLTGYLTTEADTLSTVSGRGASTATDITMNAQADVRYADSDSSNYVAIQSPATVGTNYTLTLPTTSGASGQVLQTDGTGVLTWVNANASITADSLDFTELADSMTLDASTTVNVTGTNVLSINNTGTGNSFVVNDVASDTSPFVIDASGNVGIGTTGPSGNLEVSTIDTSTELRVVNSSSTTARNPRVSIRNYTGGNGGVPTAQLLNGRGTMAAPTVINSGDLIGRIMFDGYTSASTFDTAASIQAAADATFTAVSSPGRLMFYTTDTGSTSTTERARLDSTGKFGIGTTLPGTLLDVAGAITSRPSGTGTGQTGQMIMRELAAGGTNTATIRAPDALAGDYVLTLPIDDGASGQVLRTDGSGVLTWASASSAITADSLDFTELADSMTLDASTTVNVTGTNVLSINNTGTGNSFVVNDVASDTSPFVIDASGNVGVGSTAPVAQFEIFSTSAASLPATSGAAQTTGLISRLQRSGNSVLDVGSNSGPFWIQATNSTNFATNYELLLNPNGGSVGIGTTAPGTQLDVAGAITSRPNGTGTGQTGQLILRELAAGGTNTATIRAPDALGANYALTLPIDDGVVGQVLRTDGAGLLSWVNADASIAADSLDFTELADSMTLDASTAINATGTNVLSITNAGTGNSLVVNDVAADTSPFVIDANGNVGVGSTAPATRFDIVSNSNAESTLKITRTDDTLHRNELQFRPAAALSASNVAWVMGQAVSTDAFHLKSWDGVTATHRMTVDNVGNVGIGTSVPGTLLDVTGAITSRPSGTGTGQTGQLILRELAAGGTNTATIRAPDALGANYALTLPIDDGVVGQVLRTDGAGLLSWVNADASIAADSLDFTELADSMTLDASTAINASGTNVLSITNAGTGNSFVVNDVASDTSPFVIDASGNVGVGTTTANSKLHVQEGVINVDSSAMASSLNLISRNATDGVTQRSGVYLRNADTGFTGSDGSEIVLSESNSDLIIQNRETGSTIFSNNGSEALRILSSGNVGIGTVSPGGVLHTVGTAPVYMDRYTAGQHLQLRSSTGTEGVPAASVAGNIVGRLTFNGHTGSAFGGSLTSVAGVATETWTGTANGSRLDFYTTPKTTTGSLNRMTIDDDGNVGIGTTNPVSDVEVSKGATLGVTVTATNTTNGVASFSGYKMNNNIGNMGWLYTTSSGYTASAWEANRVTLFGSSNADGINISTAGTPGDIRFLRGSTEHMRMDGSGNFGIGTTTPGRKLEVAGTTYSTGILYVGSDANGNPASNNTIGTILSPNGFIAANATLVPSAQFGRQEDGAIIQFRVAGALQGTITSTAGTVALNAFTGSHFALTEQEIARGELVTMDGEPTYRYVDYGEPYYNVKQSTLKNAANVLGAMLGRVEPTQPMSMENPYQVMSVGNGDMWVADNGEDVNVGDYLITSDVPGHAEKDIGEFEITHIVARVAENIRWNKVTKNINGIKHKKISVTFEQFDRFHAKKKFEEVERRIATVQNVSDKNAETIKKLQEDNKKKSQEIEMMKAYLCAKDPKAPFCN